MPGSNETLDSVASRAEWSVDRQLDADVKTCQTKKNFCAANKWRDWDKRPAWCWKGPLVTRNEEVDYGDEGGPRVETITYSALDCVVIGHVECVTLKKDPPPVVLPPSR